MVLVGGKPENLHPCGPGETRNPAGMKKGTKTWRGILNKILAGKMTVEEAGKKYKKSRREVIAMKLALDALDSTNSAAERTRAASTIMDRTDGKPFQPITGPEGLPIAPPVISVHLVDMPSEE